MAAPRHSAHELFDPPPQPDVGSWRFHDFVALQMATADVIDVGSGSSTGRKRGRPKKRKRDSSAYESGSMTAAKRSARKQSAAAAGTISEEEGALPPPIVDGEDFAALLAKAAATDWARAQTQPMSATAAAGGEEDGGAVATDGGAGAQGGTHLEREDDLVDGVPDIDGASAIGTELSDNVDICVDCERLGELLCCDRCPRSFCLPCLGLQAAPDGDDHWFCGRCGDSDDAGNGAEPFDREHYDSLARTARYEEELAADAEAGDEELVTDDGHGEDAGEGAGAGAGSGTRKRRRKASSSSSDSDDDDDEEDGNEGANLADEDDWDADFIDDSNKELFDTDLLVYRKCFAFDDNIYAQPSSKAYRDTDRHNHHKNVLQKLQSELFAEGSELDRHWAATTGKMEADMAAHGSSNATYRKVQAHGQLHASRASAAGQLALPGLTLGQVAPDAPEIGEAAVRAAAAHSAESLERDIELAVSFLGIAAKKVKAKEAAAAAGGKGSSNSSGSASAADGGAGAGSFSSSSFSAASSSSAAESASDPSSSSPSDMREMGTRCAEIVIRSMAEAGLRKRLFSKAHWHVPQPVILRPLNGPNCAAATGTGVFAQLAANIASAASSEAGAASSSSSSSSSSTAHALSSSAPERGPKKRGRPRADASQDAALEGCFKLDNEALFGSGAFSGIDADCAALGLHPFQMMKEACKAVDKEVEERSNAAAAAAAAAAQQVEAAAEQEEAAAMASSAGADGEALAPSLFASLSVTHPAGASSAFAADGPAMVLAAAGDAYDGGGETYRVDEEEYQSVRASSSSLPASASTSASSHASTSAQMATIGAGNLPQLLTSLLPGALHHSQSGPVLLLGNSHLSDVLVQTPAGPGLSLRRLAVIGQKFFTDLLTSLDAQAPLGTGDSSNGSSRSGSGGCDGGATAASSSNSSSSSFSNSGSNSSASVSRTGQASASAAYAATTNGVTVATLSSSATGLRASAKWTGSFSAAASSAVAPTAVSSSSAVAAAANVPKLALGAALGQPSQVAAANGTSGNAVRRSFYHSSSSSPAPAPAPASSVTQAPAASVAMPRADAAEGDADSHDEGGASPIMGGTIGTVSGAVRAPSSAAVGAGAGGVPVRSQSAATQAAGDEADEDDDADREDGAGGEDDDGRTVGEDEEEEEECAEEDDVDMGDNNSPDLGRGVAAASSNGAAAPSGGWPTPSPSAGAVTGTRVGGDAAAFTGAESSQELEASFGEFQKATSSAECSREEEEGPGELEGA